MAIFEQLHSRAFDDRVFPYAFDLLELDGRGHGCARPSLSRSTRQDRAVVVAVAGYGLRGAQRAV